jgi:hypothetical protein
MKLLKSLLLAAIFTFSVKLCGQTSGTITAQPPEFITPGGMFDKVFDQEGREYSLDKLNIKSVIAKTGAFATTCNAGYFDLFFENGSLGNGSPAQQAAYQTVICAVFTDISNFISSPLTTAGNTNKVNIWIRDISNVYANPAGYAGSATQFYTMPGIANPSVSGIVDGEVYKTIISGTDSYINVASPLISSTGSSTSNGAFFHGMATFNFDSGYNWNTSLTNLSNSTNLDLYSIALHEAVHALGFISLIDANGFSKFGANSNYYSRYDLFLRHNNLPLIKQSTIGCTNYQYQFNPAVSTNVITNSSGCSNDVVYAGSANQPVYCPPVYSAGSSLSHFQNACHPTPFAMGSSGFAMNPGGGYGVNFRFLQPEERSVLCDLGYKTISTYGSLGHNSYYNYNTTDCLGLNVGGTNDGLSNTATYIFTGSVGAPITITGLLSNDYFGTYGAPTPALAKFECLEDITTGTTLSPSTGFNNTNITFISNVNGVHLLRYIPVSPTGERGNITYVYVFVSVGSCAASPCNMVPNGDFETLTNPGSYPSAPSQMAKSCGWDHATTGTADFYHTNGTNLMTVPCSMYGYQTDNRGLNAYAGFAYRQASGGGVYGESIYAKLGTPLLPNTSYNLTFDASLAESLSSLTFPIQVYFQNSYVPSSNAFVTIGNPSMLFTAPQINNFNVWTPITIAFTTGATAGEDYIIIGPITNMPVTTPLTPATQFLNGCNYQFTPYFQDPANGQSYCYIDNITLLQSSSLGTINLNPTVCINQIILDLASHLVSASPNGVFTGPGVTVSGGVYSFDASIAGLGNHTITYSYTNNLGCIVSISTIVNVVNANINITASASPNTICLPGQVTLTASGGVTYNWLPGNFSGSPVLVTPSPGSTPYVVTGTDINGCQGTAYVNVVANPTPVVLASVVSSNFCGASTYVTPSGANTYVLQPGGATSNGAPFVVNPSVPTAYTLYGTSNGCTNSILINVTPGGAGGVCSNLHTTGTNIIVPAGNNFLVNVGYSNYNFTCYSDLVIPANANISIKNCTFMMAPGTQIRIGNKANVNIINSHFYGCTGMWQGIIMPGQNGADLTIKASVIEDAVWGVRVAAAGSTGSQNFPNKLTVDNCLFNTNTTDIDYANTNTNKLTVGHSAFTSRCLNYDPPFITLPTINGAFYNSVLATAPFVPPLDPNIPAPLYGILMYEYVNYPGQGNQIDLQTVNIFDKHIIGISTLNFNNLKIEKQIFVNGIVGRKEILTPVVNTGIYLTNSNASSSTSNPNNNFLITIGNGGNKGNTFFNLDYGIYATAPNNSSMRTIVRFNTFNTILNTGVYYTGVPYKGPVPFSTSHNINNNTFNDCRKTAINVINSGKTGMSITSNNITNPINPAIEYKGIIISEISNPVTAKYVISYNVLTNVNKGIKADNVNSPYINANRVDIVPSTISFLNFGQGITLKNCNAPSANTNTITGLYTSAGNSLEMGLSVSDCPKGYYTCNVIRNALIGAIYNGQNIGSTVRNNTFNNHAVAIYLANNGMIDVQGANSPSGAADNKFLNINGGEFHTYAATVPGVVATNGNNSPFYIRTISAQFNMTNNGADLVLPASNQILINPIINPDPYFNLCAPNPFNGGLSPLANAIANPGLFNAALIRENHTSKRQLYKELLTMTSVPNTTLQAFKTANNSSSLGRFTMVDSIISDYFEGNAGALTQAQTFNSFTTANNVENYQKQFNTLYLQYLQADSLSNAGIGQINTIAALCPYTDGTVVWQARAFARVFNDTLEFENPCETINPPNPPASARMASAENKEEVILEELINGKLIPNPNDGNFMLLLDKEVVELNLKVFDITGKEVCNNTMENTNNIQLKCMELKNGIYIVKVYNNGIYLQSHKLVIQK